MSKMYIMQGLPGSGKTTKAEEIVKRDGNTVRINRDTLREMLHFGKWSGKNEGITKDVAKAIAFDLLAKNRCNVIIDDTNLNDGTVQSWKNLAMETDSSIEYVKMDTDLETCLERDSEREKPVGDHVIIGMAMQHDLYPKPAKGIVICDIDGTLANIEHRLHFVKSEKKDWPSFFAAMGEDTPRVDIMEKAVAYVDDGFELFLVSGRPDTHREVTEKWLHHHFFQVCGSMQPYVTLFMRTANDARPDNELKEEIYTKYFKKFDVHRVIDDRPSVIRMWESQGLKVIDVGNGQEF